MQTNIDVTFNFLLDTPDGKDPDRYNETLRKFHKSLWSKRLPNGYFFDLDDATQGHYLYHNSKIGEFSLSSDAVIPTFKWNKHVQTLVTIDRLEDFNTFTYTIGGLMVFPGKRIDGKWTINQARGCTGLIGDRFDLTLECIRRHYESGTSPLSDVLTRYSNFFELFDSFRGYVEFFFLQDLVATDFSSVKISAPFDNFKTSPIPTDATEYIAYENDARQFVTERNLRIMHSS